MVRERVRFAVDLFGAAVVVTGVTDEGAIVRSEHGIHALAGGNVKLLARLPEVKPLERGPFTQSEFGAGLRLVWPGGGCALKAQTRLAFWADRYAALVEPKRITIVDATTGRQVRIELPPGIWLAGTGIGVVQRTLAIAGGTGVYEVSLDELEAVAAGDQRTETAELIVRYPVRRVEARELARIGWVATNYVLVNLGQRQLRLPAIPGAQNGMNVVLLDELVPGTFAAMEVGGVRYEITAPEAPRTFAMKLVRGKTRDPAETGAMVAPTERVDELERLMIEVARAPDDEAPRLVLADLLQDLGETFGAWLAREGGGAITPAKRRKALGPLAHYLDEVEFRGGLPWAARLVRRAPHADEHVAPALNDLRLGMLATLRCGRGSPALYARFVGSPRAIGLRHVDVPDRGVAKALIAAKRDQLESLAGVRFVDRGPMRLLADPTFDRVATIEAPIQATHVQGLLTRIADDEHGFFTRRPRHVWMREQSHRDFDLVGPVLERFGDLPVRGLSVDGITLVRDGEQLIARTGYQAAQSYEVLVRYLTAIGITSLELGHRDPHLLESVRRLFPDVAVTMAAKPEIV